MNQKLRSFFKNKSILITGGTGSFGKSFIKHLLKNFQLKRIVIFSRDEQKQFFMSKSPEFSNSKFKNLRYFLGDIRDYERLNFAMRDIDLVVHAAALKHVSIAEYNPMEFISTNINGSNNVIRACINNRVDKVISLSTDKAVNPINLYGATKLAADKLFISANNIVGKANLSFSVVRYGNVFGSRGSVIEIFKKIRDQNKKTYPITDKRMTRFFITLDQAITFVIKNFIRMKGGEIFVPKLPSIKIKDLVPAFDTSAKIKEIGISPGEKIHEIMFTKDDNVVEFNDFYLLKPQIEILKKNHKYLENDLKEKGKSLRQKFDYSSGTNEDFIKSTNIKKNFVDL